MLRKYLLCEDAAVSKRVVSAQQSRVLALLIIANSASGFTLKIQHYILQVECFYIKHMQHYFHGNALFQSDSKLERFLI